MPVGTQKIIGVDFDEVIAESYRAMCALHSRNTGRRHTIEDCVTHDLCKLWGVEMSYLVRLLQEHLRGGAMHHPPFLSGAKQGIKTLSKRFGVAIVTARDVCFESATHAQIDALECDIHAVHLCTDASGKTASKAEICRNHGYLALVDDNASAVNDCVRAGLGGFVFGNYPWNRDYPVIPSACRVNSWRDLLEAIEVGALDYLL
jgi:hypothetical protein